MKWRGRQRSENVIDVGGGEADAAARAPGRRGGKKVAAGGGLGLLLMAVIALVASGGDVGQVLSLLSNQVTAGTSGGSSAGTGSSVAENSAQRQEQVDFVSVVLADTEGTWREVFREMGKTYEDTTLYTFRDQISSACGFQTSAVGPFYCGADKSVYIDLTFWDDLARRHGAAGDFARAYVVAHEVGHHVQNILGISEMVYGEKRGKSELEKNQWSVRQELHADFLAGLWAHHARKRDLLERGDLEEALNAASQIGDDTLQRKARGSVQPESFTHGTADQRRRWFELGYNTGDMKLGFSIYETPYGEL